MSNLGPFIPLVLIVLVFWVLVIRPQRKRQQELTRTQKALEIGTEVMLGSGIFGQVVAVADETVRVEVAPGTTIKVARQAVVRVVQPTAADSNESEAQPAVEPGAQPEPDVHPDIRRDEPQAPAGEEGPVDLSKNEDDTSGQPGKQDQ